ncbi:hypothetical protein [Nocardiopsis dassonvillei]|uniref:hypothetical protein n=1 Tax=Nocardiopsis dassonvillei TaxID=2014 RepID=UPI003671517B
MSITSKNVDVARDFYVVLQNELKNFDGTEEEKRGLRIRYAIARSRITFYMSVEDGTFVQDDRCYLGILEVLNDVTDGRFEEFIKGRVAS